MWTDEAHFSLHGGVNTQNNRIWTTSNPREYLTKPLHSPHVTVWCGFTASFILSLFFFEERCPVSGWNTCTVTEELYVTLLRNHVVPALQERDALTVDTSFRMVPRLTLNLKSGRSCWKLSLKTEC
ncbi:hypothetical protein AVEN_261310-1 [Araneus ventricosus]|uniref:Uncharacterized protein n=1 Tax=Araneus ventricosus TaxID=182803 RepID=A0A4Y2J0M3_ARAVE|nr:hypothetical protein AVEN_261310-1 [Araneus ventricosus]